ncbi:MAG: tetratricopeptide repeat protein [Maritimibacter sp.]
MFKKFFVAAVLAASPAFAEVTEDMSQFGTTNPEEMTLDKVLDRAEKGDLDMPTCAAGYFITKSGRHVQARALFEACAAAGYTGAMTWMSQLDNNGLGGEYDPQAAANWDRQAAELGDRVGKFNYGIDLLRGHGVHQNEVLGRQLVDQAAAEGLPAARRLQGADYDLDEVTPDADNWKYAPLF